jgi:hypothetical protein
VKFCIGAFHQSIAEFQVSFKSDKSEELISFLNPDFPQVLCSSEHHLKRTEIDFIYMDQYKPGAKLCREYHKNGGVSIILHDTLQCTNINLDEFCKEQDIEACAVRINLSSLTICIISLYRSPMGNFLHNLRLHSQFLTQQYN